MELDYDYIAKLVRKTQEGDSDAFAELYTATYQSQYRFAYQYVKDPYLAQDILQEVYILVLKNLDTLKNPRLFVSWLHQITFRICFFCTCCPVHKSILDRLHTNNSLHAACCPKKMSDHGFC